MKLLSLEIQKFAKLSDVTLKFEPNCNVLRHENGFGKTTLAAFVKAMFYGLNYTGKQNALGERENDVARYMPWNSDGKFGGSLTFENNGKTYRIERFFGKTAKSEECNVICTETGEKLQFDTSIGEYFLGLTADSFERSMYYPQDSIELRANENFDQLLAGLVENGGAGGDKAVEILRKKRKTLRHEIGNGGRINEIRNCISELERNRINASHEQTQFENNSKTLEQLAAEKSRLDEQISAQSKVLDDLKAKNSAQNSRQNDKIEEQISLLEAKIANVSPEFESDFNKAVELDCKLTELEKSFAPRTVSKLPLLISAALAVLAITLGVMLHFAFGITFGLLAVAVFGYFVLNTVGSRRQNVSKKAQIDDLSVQFAQITSKYCLGTRKEVLDNMRESVGERLQNLRIRDALAQNIAKKDLVDYSQQISEAQQKLDSLSFALRDVIYKTATLTEQNKSLCKVSPVEYQDKIGALKTELQQLEKQYNDLTLAIDLISHAKEKLSVSYLPRLSARASELFCQISGKSYGFTVNRNFAVCLTEDGHTKLIDSYSRGTREMALLCFRVALSELIYDGRVPLLIIDDAFVNYDDQNFGGAMALIKKLAEAGTQIIYFTCHSR